MTTKPRQYFVQCLTPAGLHRMAYREWGDPDCDRVLVCVHGLTRVGADFDELAEAMSDHYRVVCPDVVGRGDSDWLADPVYYQTPVYVADMVTLLARINAKTLHWFGTSMGGLIGMGIASLKNSPIKRMVLNDVGPSLTAASLSRIGAYLGQQMHFDTASEAQAHIRQVAAPFGASSDAQWKKLTEDALRPDAGGGVRLHYDPRIAETFRASLGSNPQDLLLWDLYDRITCPVMVVRGETSDLLTAETVAEMARRGPRAKSAVIKGVGHAPMFVTSEQIEIARGFLLETETVDDPK
jgi:pimeloyl-ACP methyl ester carboxylesterase